MISSLMKALIKKAVEACQAEAIFVWSPKERADLKIIHDENNVLMDDELVIVRDFLRTSKHACLYIRNEHPRGFNVLNHA